MSTHLSHKGQTDNTLPFSFNTARSTYSVYASTVELDGRKSGSGGWPDVYFRYSTTPKTASSKRRLGAVLSSGQTPVSKMLAIVGENVVLPFASF